MCVSSSWEPSELVQVPLRLRNVAVADQLAHNPASDQTLASSISRNSLCMGTLPCTLML